MGTFGHWALGRLAALAMASAMLIGTTSGAAAASKGVNYVATGNNGSAYADFNITLPAPISGATTITPNAFFDSCDAGDTFFGADSCNSIGFDGGVATVNTNNPPFSYTFVFQSDAFQYNGTYTGAFQGSPGAGTLTVTGAADRAAPGAPAPLLGFGLLPGLAAGGGFVATRRRRKAAR